jgi:fatty acid desaturase
MTNVRTIPLLSRHITSAIRFHRHYNKMTLQVKSESTSVEWRTFALVVLTYSLWWVVVANFQTLPLLMIPALLLILSFHTSLVHELIHGHPTRISWLNDLMGTPPLALIYPYAVFKDTHLRHHHNEDLTLPGIDPESFYCCPEEWRKKSEFTRALAWINMTLTGRLILNPMFSLIQMMKLCLNHLANGTLKQKLIWVVHLPAAAGILYIATVHYSVPLWIYLACAYGAHSVIGLRAFFEHRAIEDPDERIVIVDACGFFKFLFLGNNFHATHHRYPGLPWYKIEQCFRQESQVALRDNGNFYFAGYRDWLRFLFHPVASPVHPFAQGSLRTSRA